jgi:hypothetical protein
MDLPVCINGSSLYSNAENMPEASIVYALAQAYIFN